MGLFAAALVLVARMLVLYLEDAVNSGRVNVKRRDKSIPFSASAIASRMSCALYFLMTLYILHSFLPASQINFVSEYS